MAPQTLTIPTDNWGGTRPKKLHLMHLLDEILNVIFRLVLVEPPRWDKRHKADCDKKCLSDYLKMEEPPFYQTSFHAVTSKKRRAQSPCLCARRRGLGLLRVCRSIKRAANDIFWTMNTFCFIDAADFVYTVGECVTRQNQERLRNVSIMNPDLNDGFPFQSYIPGDWQMANFVKVLMQCTGLRRLEMPAIYLNAQLPPNFFYRVSKNLPHLDAVHFNFLITFGYDNYAYNANGYPWPGSAKAYDVLFVGCSRPTPVRPSGEEQPWDEARMRELFRDLRYNFYIHVIRAVRTKCLGSNKQLAHDPKSALYFLPRSITEHDNVRPVRLETGQDTTVTFYGLPSSSKTRLAVARGKREQDRVQRAKDGMRRPERAAKDTAWQRQRAEREEEQAEQRRLHTSAVEHRQQIRDKAEAAAIRAAKKEKKMAQKNIGKATARRMESRQGERKRVLRL